MNFGDKLRQLRNDKQLTQPELAEAMGIEQSYLSKLENDKSLPSNDVLNRILDVFDLELGEMISDLGQGAKNQLRQLPDVAAHLNKQKQQIIGNRRRWLIASALFLSLGVALIYAGNEHLFFSNYAYQYKSDGILHDGEPKELLHSPAQYIPISGGHEESARFLSSIQARLDESYVQYGEFNGNIFNVPVEGGSRTYYITDETEIDPWQSKAVVFLGVLLTMFGATGILLERKLSQ
ncbi:MAG: transcriptional regulator with XRE-family HTH domain [Woeseiaceae bacterium]|jgi:transcriptional regulator with XRE-family HTH domain